MGFWARKEKSPQSVLTAFLLLAYFGRVELSETQTVLVGWKEGDNLEYRFLFLVDVQ